MRLIDVADNLCKILLKLRLVFARFTGAVVPYSDRQCNSGDFEKMPLEPIISVPMHQLAELQHGMLMGFKSECG